MRSPVDLLLGRVNGMPKRDIARRTVPCYKHVVEPEGRRLGQCLLIDHGKLYRYPYESLGISRSLAVKARYLKGEMEHLRLWEIQPGLCRYVDGPSAGSG